ncbi:unnamed protein product [Caenorhabditis sp. 36 PRJEB53466]|nr:unnamed protein product [Caenorhabditis sp. 36 PRJEB53466]
MIVIQLFTAVFNGVRAMYKYIVEICSGHNECVIPRAGALVAEIPLDEFDGFGEDLSDGEWYEEEEEDYSFPDDEMVPEDPHIDRGDEERLI